MSPGLFQFLQLSSRQRNLPALKCLLAAWVWRQVCPPSREKLTARWILSNQQQTTSQFTARPLASSLVTSIKDSHKSIWSHFPSHLHISAFLWPDHGTSGDYHSPSARPHLSTWWRSPSVGAALYAPRPGWPSLRSHFLAIAVTCQVCFSALLSCSYCCWDLLEFYWSWKQDFSQLLGL